MATYYVSAATGNDANAGTSSGTAWATLTKAMNTVAAGDKVWIKADANYNETATIITAGTVTSPIVFEGYTTTTGDGGQIIVDGQSTRANGLASSLGSVAHYYVIRNWHAKNCTGAGFSVGTGGDSMCYVNCWAENNGAQGFLGDNDCSYFKCKANLNSTNGIQSDLRTVVIGGVFADNTTGANVDSGIIAFNEFYGNSDRAIWTSSGKAAFVVGNTIDGENAAGTTGIDYSNASLIPPIVAVNNIVYDLATGIAAGRNLGDQIVSYNNLLNSNTTNYSNFSTLAGEVTGAPAFSNEAAADYTLQSSSPAKAAGVDAGEFVNAVSYMDIGAHQRQEPAGGGGGGMIVNPGTSGGAHG